MLSKDLETTLNLAFKSTRKKRHEFMTVEHLLLSLLDNEVAASVLVACDCDLSRLRGELVDFVDATTPLIPESEETRETQPTL
ncbi:MAG TPA: Clp protease N-terminal domain-containing protein, partial [Gammaproteobacteria bacterium]|nr:Clp protease N-terminal domain-containing protein [Gammaproteobacteria bacterium]